MVRIHQLPAFTDNYIYLLEEGRNALAIDPGDPRVILNFLKENSYLKLTYILNTHHHSDHVGGNQVLVQETGAKVIGFSEDAHRIPLITKTVEDGDSLTLLGLSIQVLHVPGHTTGHIAFYIPDLKALFCGDTLFGLGCGRLFEGTAEQMWTSLQRLNDLPEDTQVFCAHEYTVQNGHFACSISPDDRTLEKYLESMILKREKNQPTVPSLLKSEQEYNPFLKAESPSVFSHLRKQKDQFY